MTDRQREIIEGLDWTIHDVTFSGNVPGYELQKYSPAGEDFIFSVEADNLVDNVKAYAAGFDLDEHIAMWIEVRQNKVRAVPSPRELVEDAYAIDAMLKELAEALFADELGPVEPGLPTTHVVELWIKRLYTVYVEDKTGTMTEAQMRADAIRQAVDDEANLTPTEGIEIEEQDVVGFEYQYDLDD